MKVNVLFDLLLLLKQELLGIENQESGGEKVVYIYPLIGNNSWFDVEIHVLEGFTCLYVFDYKQQVKYTVYAHTLEKFYLEDERKTYVDLPDVFYAAKHLPFLRECDWVTVIRFAKHLEY